MVSQTLIWRGFSSVWNVFRIFFVQNLNEKMKNSNFKPLTARSAHFQETAKQTGFWIDKQHSTINQKNDNFNVSTLLKTEP